MRAGVRAGRRAPRGVFGESFDGKWHNGRAELCIDMRIDMRIDSCMDTSIDMYVDICMDTCIDVYTCA